MYLFSKLSEIHFLIIINNFISINIIRFPQFALVSVEKQVCVILKLHTLQHQCPVHQQPGGVGVDQPGLESGDVGHIVHTETTEMLNIRRGDEEI